MKLELSGLVAARRAVPAALDVGVARAANMILDLAQQLCPVDTGDLKGSGRVEDVGLAGVRRVTFGGDGVDYARYVEYGTSVSPAQPFLTPAARAINVEAEIQQALKDALR